MRLLPFFFAVVSSFASIVSCTPVEYAVPGSIGGLADLLGVEGRVLAALGDRVPLGNANFTCTALRLASTQVGSVVSPSSGPNYTRLEDQNWSETCWLPAACIVSPANRDHVSRLVKVLSRLQTRFAIRGGGHKDAPGFASIDGTGILISLSNLNTRQLSVDKSIVTVGSGNRWGDVYSTVEPVGRTVVGGRVSPVGVPGFTLGGGLSYFASQWGLAIDNVVRFEIVLGDGSIVNATTTLNGDLFRALKGGASNFGIVTAYDFVTHPLGNVYFEARSYASDQAPSVLQALASYQLGGQLDPKSNVALNLVPTGSLLVMVYSDPARSPAAFAPFYNITSYQTVIAPTNGSFSGLVQAGVANFPSEPQRTHGTAVSHKADGKMTVDAFNIFLEEIANLPPNVSATFSPQPIAKSCITYGKRQYGGNSLGLQEVAQQWINIFASWTDPAADERAYSVLNTISRRIRALTQQRGVDIPYLFMNDASSNQPVLQSYGADNVARFKAAAASYDPRQVFQKLQNDGYLLRKL